ncbi:MAG: TniB family NTP-binding protein [Betaproteobacteria bacterium]
MENNTKDKQQLGYLDPSAQATLFAAIPNRIAFLEERFWIGYPAAEAILERLNLIMSRPRVSRPEGLLILGDPYNGKTRLLEYFQSLHPPIISGRRGTIQLPVICIDAPSGARQAYFFDSLSDALHIPGFDRRPVSLVHGRIIQALRDAGTKIIIVDELHNLLSGGEIRKQFILEELKTFSNALKIALVGAGTGRALSVIKDDQQYLSRMPPVMLPPWKLNRTFLGLLKALEARMPLREASNLASDRNISELIYTHSQNCIGHIVNLILESTRLALNKGHENLTEELFRQACSSSLPWMKV